MGFVVLLLDGQVRIPPPNQDALKNAFNLLLMLCAANFLLALFILTESRKPTSEHVVQRPHLEQWLHTLRTPKIGLLVIVFFLATFCFSCFESTLPLLVSDNFHLDIQTDAASATTVTVPMSNPPGNTPSSPDVTTRSPATTSSCFGT